MSAAIGLWGDFDAARLRGIAKQAKDGPQARRLLTLVSIHEAQASMAARQVSAGWQSPIEIDCIEHV